MRDTLNPETSIRGRVKAFQVLPYGTTPLIRLASVSSLPGIWLPRTPKRKNSILYDWATIVGDLLSGDNKYRVAGMYIEYQNVNNANTTVTVPAFGRSDGISYYDNLASSPDRDYLRMPLVASTLTSTDPVKFPGGNLLTFWAQSSAAAGFGINGKPFNNTAISKVYGGALVAMPAQADKTQDLVFSRFYFNLAADQQAKLVASQIGLTWEIELQ